MFLPEIEYYHAMKEDLDQTPFLSKEEIDSLAELETDTVSILNKLREDIEKGSYNAVLGDDASGRIPALVIWHFLAEIYARRGFAKPAMRFVAGSAGSDAGTQDELDAYISRIKNDVSNEAEENKKVLVVTDFIDSGASLQGILDSCDKHGLTFDIASIGIVARETIADLADKYHCNVVYGKRHTPMIYGKDSLSGVQKERLKDVIAHKLPEINQRKINAVREYVKKHIVPSLIEAYESNR